jgi:hypothetical protein
MRVSRFLAISTLLFIAASPAQASWLDYIFTPSMPHFERPYLEEGKMPHNSQWETDTWTPEGWTDYAGSKEAVLAGLEGAGIITDYDLGGYDPELKVGRPFIRLSDQEKTRVMKYVDHVYGVTKNNGVIEIELDSGCFLLPNTTIGYYTSKGLQIQ